MYMKDVMGQWAQRARGRRGLKPWWTREVAEAIQYRQEASRVHRHLSKYGDPEAVVDAWETYRRLKQDVAVLVQGWVRRMNRKFMGDLREAGRQAPQRFWRYVQRLNQQISQVALRGSPDEEEVTGEECIPLLEEWLRSLQRQDAPDTLSEDMAGPYGRLTPEEQAEADLRLAPTEREFKRAVMVHTIFADKSTKWTRRTAALRRRFGLPTICLEEAAQKPRDPMGRGTRLQVRQREAAAWRKAAEEKSSLELYRSEKLEIRTESCYDNSMGSALLAEARAGVLRTRIWRARFTEGVSTTCALCGKSDETLRHVVLECGGIFPPTRTQALPTALGFKTEEVEAAEVTKKRLEFWWQHGALRR
ncbi:hypothetical protein HPB49_010962 [Dermacentor silvarum]|uniref:Uncharacterized protein n=1 Tax=Dermacentor silvarum TaxID=543639 RepID=A0ACB8CEV7_DERSI|nr:hypothetical protein HPB49_010962 [Dermacentor silvarum]